MHRPSYHEIMHGYSRYDLATVSLASSASDATVNGHAVPDFGSRGYSITGSIADGNQAFLGIHSPRSTVVREVYQYSMAGHFPADLTVIPVVGLGYGVGSLTIRNLLPAVSSGSVVSAYGHVKPYEMDAVSSISFGFWLHNKSGASVDFDRHYASMSVSRFLRPDLVDTAA
jgi:hypothetical protein